MWCAAVPTSETGSDRSKSVVWAHCVWKSRSWLNFVVPFGTCFIFDMPTMIHFALVPSLGAVYQSLVSFTAARFYCFYVLFWWDCTKTRLQRFSLSWRAGRLLQLAREGSVPYTKGSDSLSCSFSQVGILPPAFRWLLFRFQWRTPKLFRAWVITRIESVIPKRGSGWVHLL